MTNQQKIARCQNRIDLLNGRTGVSNGKIVAKLKRQIRALENQK